MVTGATRWRRILAATILAAALAVVAGPPVGAHSDDSDAPVAPYILGGVAALPEFGDLVPLIQLDDGGECTGAFIEPGWVLTAAHCVEHRATVWAGSHSYSEQWWSSRATGHRHPNYDPNTLWFDFGLYELDEAHPFPAGPRLAGIDDVEAWTPGAEALVFGWGIFGSDGSVPEYLQAGSLTVQHDADCAVADAALGHVFDPASAICLHAPAVSICDGDSGGPVYAESRGEWVLVGVNSYSAQWCDLHTGAAWVPAARSWIDATIAGLPPLPAGLSVADANALRRLYRAYFLRDADAGGLFYWGNLFVNGRPLSAISGEFAASAEFTSTYGALSDPEFVTLVYRNVLERDPDTDGLGYWTEMLAAGRTRGWVMIGFSNSAEFRSRTGLP